MSEQVYPVVFSDLDGTLLDHDTYSFEPAADAIRLLKRRGIPIARLTERRGPEGWADAIHDFVWELESGRRAGSEQGRVDA